MNDEKKPFTVSDRRHFTAEGETRTEAEKEERTVEPEARRPPRPAAPAPAPPAAEGPEPPAWEPPPGAGSPFVQLVFSLAAQASLLLGAGPEEEGLPEPDPQAARVVISMLEMLREKTEGRRTPEEEDVLEKLLFELRMAFLARTQSGGA